jgi:transglutaminase-like putative cysteine protease
MRVRVLHDTVYTYDRPVRGLIQVLRLTPRDHDGQHLRSWRIEPSADGRLRPSEDTFGNLVHTFSADGPVDALTVHVVGEVETVDTHGIIRGAVERLPEPFYLRESSLAAADTEIRAFARDVAGDYGADPLAALHRLLAALHQEVRFEPGPNSKATNAANAFARRRGVCQDLSHIFIAAARLLGIPARYVSGYVYRGEAAEPQTSHAWAEAKVPGFRWVGFDPVNGISPGEAHIRVAIGLDYLGAAPIRGSRIGGGTENLDVKLRVETSQFQVQAQA